MKKNKLPKINSKEILSAFPRGCASAILSAALGVLIIATLLPESADSIFLGAVMVLCAVFSLLLELLQLPKAVNIILPVFSAAGGAAALFIPRGENGKNLFSLLMGKEGVAAESLIIPSVCLCIVLCWGVVMVNRSYVLRCIAAGGISLSFIILVLTRMSLLPVITVLMLAYALIVLCQVFAPKVKTADGKRHEPWYSLICLLAAIIALQLPMPQTRIPWEKLFEVRPTEQLQQISQTLDIDALEPEPEEAKNTGFDDDASSIGGWVEVTEGYPIEVTFVDGVTVDRLAGSIYDQYTGKGWECTVPITGTGYVSGSDIVLQSDSDASPVQDCSRAVIQKLSTRGGTIFIPPYTVSIFTDDNADIERDGGQLIFSQSRIGSYTAYFDDSRPCPVLTDSQRQAYLALPENLPQRVVNLAHSVASRKPDDLSKADALMKILSRYTYETKVGSVPEESDFVDHFLFSAREGYCVYFASAMAVLARCEGIPSRLVIGYAVPDSDQETIRVGNANAHAWAELYIEGKGWVVYDPVPANAAAFAPQDEPVEVEENTENEGLFAEENLAVLKKTLLYAYAAIAGFIALFFALRPFVRRIVSCSRLAARHRSNAGYPILRRFHKLIWVLSACGIRREDSETADEFGRRVSAQCPWLTPAASEKMRHLLDNTGKALYSSSPDCKNGNQGAARAVRRSYIRTHGPFRYIRGWWRARV